MSAHFALARFVALPFVALSLANATGAALAMEDAAIAGDASFATIPPGTRCMVKADLECEIHEIKDDAICVKIAAFQEAEQGVPILDKLPPSERLFKNAGTVQTEVDVVLEIPRERIAEITPDAAGDISGQARLQHAADHLRAAGLETLAKRVERQVERQARRSDSAQRGGAPTDARPTPLRPQTGDDQSATASEAIGDDEPPQVMVALQVVELSHSKLRALGLDFQFAESVDDSALDASDAKQNLRRLTTSRIVQSDSLVLQLIEPLRKSGVAKVLAEPTLVTVAGRPASFHSGGEFPAPQQQSQDQAGIEYRKYGTQVDLVPVYLGDEKLRLDLRVVVSEIAPSRSMAIGDKALPRLRSRSITTTVELDAGQTLVLGGLVQDFATKDDLRARGKRRGSEEVELILIATTSLVAPTEVAKSQ